MAEIFYRCLKIKAKHLPYLSVSPFLVVQSVDGECLCYAGIHGKA